MLCFVAAEWLLVKTFACNAGRLGLIIDSGVMVRGGSYQRLQNGIYTSSLAQTLIVFYFVLFITDKDKWFYGAL